MDRDPIVAAGRIRYGLLPVDPVHIATRLGIDVLYRPFNPRMSGCLIPEPTFPHDPEHFLIVVNSRHPRERQNFTIAHEIGHFVLHRSLRPQFVCRVRSNNGVQSDPLDHEADAFATELLMPESVVRQFAPSMAFTALAALFGVSRSTMHWRLIQVGMKCA